MTSAIEYLGDLRTKATHMKSGVEMITDAPTDNQGKGESFFSRLISSPTSLLVGHNLIKTHMHKNISSGRI